ncbi:cob(I)yrinic acid a,c-diamide adenosyltransferase [Lactobacillus intestinalis]|uniref:cob(I)yrinic acid a,c-diamide adenosyltransferase n=1 Tax=Lactobacillus intestinalis TaxID=151781 RepID=UPI00242B8262|nr:cob(I)yrinic acid a,c-diamide adenosyltransferase [Lactobacillus intestinalis]
MIKIYTKVGDQGSTRQASGKMVAKDDAQIVALGNIDELQSYLGVAIANLSSNCDPLKAPLQQLQRRLYILEAGIAVEDHWEISDQDVKNLEAKIDEMTSKIPPMKEFILPGGDVTGANLQYSRTLARRAERSLVSLNHIQRLNPYNLKYLNRLSDYLFTLARYANLLDGYEDVKSKE